MKRKTVLALLTAFLAIILSLSSFAAELFDERLMPLLVDNADLLDDGQENVLLLTLEHLSEIAKCDIAVVTVNSLEGKIISDYTDDFYDLNGYGQGENYDGIMLLISMNEREVHISDCGYVYDALSQSTLDRLREQITPFLSNGDYFTAFSLFAERSAQLIADSRMHKADSTDYWDDPEVSYVPDYGYDPDYGYGDQNKSIGAFFEDIGNIPIICIIIGIIGGFIAVSIMKGKLKSVRRRNEASDYVIADSLNITASNDIYLYTTMRKTPRPKDNSSSGGSRSSGGGHSSSSGRSHSGSSGRF